MFPPLNHIGAVHHGTSWSLQGTSGTPVEHTYNTTQPDVANLIWSITGNTTGSNNTQKGYIQWDGYDSGDASTYANQHAFVAPLTAWSVIYVRLTADTGTPDAVSNAVDGSTWHTLTEDSNNIWWRETNATASPEECVVKVEFCTVGDGSNIVATGYYGSTVLAEV